ncbi:TetR/AcrR family transcriptional regulator [Ligilactobacillus pobuzihii]|uniref:TetR/AcrR family transcriptional regulator n=1 Tax=Ligilactobacillus pobuzihii TaxID=449659 RepID=UPI0019D01993|nr:TetR/AcrR family transcriptional regulator [Ligilactobacillus pobuzihii]MBN7275365.1 TetR/AcrR family transcriptional regulator [Ligilactobacillus pobuzihii]
MDQRVVNTKKKLREALFFLLDEKPLEKISITELCAHAQVSRGTFYIHYIKVTDVFDDFKLDLAMQVAQALTLNYPDVDTLIDTFNKILFQNLTGFWHLCNNQQHQRLVNDLINMLFNTLCTGLEINKNDREQQIILQFVANGIVNSYVFWLLNQKTTDFDTLVKTDRELLHSCLCVLKKIN